MSVRFQIFPGIEIHGEDSRAEVHNLTLGFSMPADAALVDLLRRAATPQTASALGLDDSSLAALRQRYLLMAEDEGPLFAPGLQQAPLRPLAEPLMLASLERAEGIAFIGAPMDAGGGLGARKGPELMRRAFPVPLGPDRPPRLFDYELRREVDLAGLRAWDLGDVPWAPDDGLETYGRRLRHVVSRLLAAGAQPMIMGGDHSITAHTLPAFFEVYPELHVVHFDAHTDLSATPGRHAALTHANPLLHALRDARLASLLQLGVRMLEPVRDDPRVDERVRYFSARELFRADPAEVFAHLPAGAPCYLTFDADVMSPFEAPNTGTPEIGGLGYYTAMELIAALSARMNLVGADFVEVAATPGGLTGTNTTALIASRLMMQLVLDRAESRPITGYLPAG